MFWLLGFQPPIKETEGVSQSNLNLEGTWMTKYFHLASCITTINRTNVHPLLSHPPLSTCLTSNPLSFNHRVSQKSTGIPCQGGDSLRPQLFHHWKLPIYHLYRYVQRNDHIGLRYQYGSLVQSAYTLFKKGKHYSHKLTNIKVTPARQLTKGWKKRVID